MYERIINTSLDRIFEEFMKVSVFNNSNINTVFIEEFSLIIYDEHSVRVVYSVIEISVISSDGVTIFLFTNVLYLSNFVIVVFQCTFWWNLLALYHWIWDRALRYLSSWFCWWWLRKCRERLCFMFSNDYSERIIFWNIFR